MKIGEQKYIFGQKEKDKREKIRLKGRVRDNGEQRKRFQRWRYPLVEGWGK